MTLLLGDHDFALRYQNFVKELSRDQTASAWRGDARSATGRPDYGGGVEGELSKIQLAVGLDAGSSRTRCMICALEGDQIRYLGHGLAPRRAGPKAA